MENLQNILANDYCGIDNFLKTVILPVMQCGIERKNIDLLDDDNKRANAALSNIKSILHVGTLDWMGSSDIEVYDVTLRDNAKISRSRVGIQRLIKSNLFPFSHAFMVFHYENPAYRSWRFSYCFKQESLNNTTPAKRFTYLFGRDFPCRTAVDRLNLLARSKRNDKDLEEAFSVQALSDEFFYKYLGYYAVFTEFITGIRVEKAKLDRKEIKEIVRWFEQTECYQKRGQQFAVFNNDEKNVSDYVKKMLGRIVFLYFLEHKGWLAGNHNYMHDLLANVSETDKEDFLDKMLEPMFFGLLNTKPEDRRQLLINGVSPSSLPQADAIPYLNGGLFQQEEIDLINSDFPYELFKALFDFFDSYNFTIDENDPDDAEVGVDPEMLGKIFESLLEDNKDKGAFYTPKEIVDYMCRESLIAYLQTDIEDEATKEALRQFVTTHDVEQLGANKKFRQQVDEALKTVKICDPAIGSGAFPMGLLNLLVKCREALGCGLSRVELKREIIQNNIYGVDIEKGAVDIARLRFWLSLIVDEDTPQALPNLDYKIVEGNSLLTTFDGKYINLDTKGQQHFRVNEMREEKRKLYQLKKNFYGAYGAQKMEVTIAIKDSILRLIAMQLGYESRSWLSKNTEQLDLFEARQLSLNEMLPKLPEETQRIVEHCNMLHSRLNDETISLSERAQTDIRFFDWRVIFTEVFDNDNPGFDIVIGNPPYGAKLDSEEKKYCKRTYRVTQTNAKIKGSSDTFCAFIECGFLELKRNGVLSYIVPMSVTSSDAMGQLHELLNENCESLYVSSFSNRPKQIFESAGLRVSIMRFRRTDTRMTKLLTTKLIRRRSSDSLTELLDNLKFANTLSYRMPGRYAKVGSEIEIRILNKLLSANNRLADYEHAKSKPIFYRAAGGRYFNVITDYTTNTSAEKSINVEFTKQIGLCLSSTMFWFYQQVYTDGLNLKSTEIKSFPLPDFRALGKKKLDEMAELYQSYLADIEQKANVRQSSGNSSYNVDIFKEYKIVRSMDMVSKIDNIVCPLYNLSKEETEFIKNYEIELRKSGE